MFRSEMLTREIKFNAFFTTLFFLLTFGNILIGNWLMAPFMAIMYGISLYNFTEECDKQERL